MSDLQSWQHAESLLAAGQWKHAQEAFERLLAVPEFEVAAHLRLSLIASKHGALRQATEHALAAYRSRPQDADALAMVAKRLFTLGEFERAIECATSPAIWQTRDPAIPAELGKVMSDAFEPTHAVALLRRARALGLNSAGVHYLLGLCLMYCGDREQATYELQACLTLAPNFAQAYWALSKLSGKSGQGNRVDAMKRVLSNEKDPAAQGLLGYALFKELDQPGNEAEAWEVLAVAMRTRRSLINYSALEEGKLFDVLEEQVVPAAQPATPATGPQPIFIVGMPRTGTSLLEGLLSRHADVSGGGELHDMVLQLRWECDLPGGPYLDKVLAERAATSDFNRVGERYLSHTQWRAKNARWYTDKMPANHFNVGYIAAALPHARIIHMVRDPMDTCFSSLKELFAGAYLHSYSQEEMALHFVRYRKLMATWKARLPGRILDVSYEGLVRQPEMEMARVLEFCSLPVDQNVASRSGFVGELTTASANQLREGVHERYVGQWKRYSNYLTPMANLLDAGLSVAQT